MIDSFESTYVSFSWEQPLFNGGQALSGFKLYRQECSDSLSAAVLIETVPPSQFEYTDTTTTGDLLYYYTVVAFNQIGGDSPSSVQAQVTPITVPSGLPAPTLVTRTQTSLTVQWYIPASNGASEI
jgi:hypothetical protein